MKLLIIMLALSLASCSKNIGGKEPSCRFYTLLSDKYTGDSIYLKTDTLWGKSGQYAYACNADLDSMKANSVTWYWCEGISGECLRYVFDNKIELPKLLK